MPDNVLRLPLEVPTAPEGFCNTLGPDWIQQLLNLFGQSVALLGGAGGTGTIILNQKGMPTSDQQGFLWRIPSLGRIYEYTAGAWISPHQFAANDEVAGMWVEATPNQIWAWDGGDGTDPAVNPPTANNGAMWDIDHDYDGRSPMGAGAIPGSFPAKVLSLGENVGEGAHTQLVAEMAPHTHTPDPTLADGFLGHAAVGSPATFNVTAGGDTISMAQTASTGGGTAMNVTHPVRGQYYIRRTARANYIAT